jgi:hypothetical protein
MKGCIYFHQGWTDIINCLPLINYYANSYDELALVIREDSKPIVDYYTRYFSKPNLNVIYVPKNILDTSMFRIPEEYKLLYHGYHDRWREDVYKNRFMSEKMYFAKGFYEYYDIPFSTKVECFKLERDHVLEESKYQDFIDKYGEEYILFHDDQNTPGGDTGINLNDILKDSPNAINLNGITDNVFSYIKILENAKEIHLVDSIWAATCYLIDGKYKLFSNKNIYLYAFKTRGGGLMEKYEDKEIFPIHPENWIIKNI